VSWRPALLDDWAKIRVPLIFHASGIRQRNDLVQLHTGLLAIIREHVRANNVTNISSRGDEEVDSPLGQVILMRRVDCNWRRNGGRSILVVYVTV
jgi:hypothetical protein